MPAALAFFMIGIISVSGCPWARMITSAFWEIAWLMPAAHSFGVPWLVYSTHLAPYFSTTFLASLSTETTYGTALVTGMLKIVLPLIFDMSKAGASSLNSGTALAASICLFAYATPGSPDVVDEPVPEPPPEVALELSLLLPHAAITKAAPKTANASPRALKERGRCKVPLSSIWLLCEVLPRTRGPATNPSLLPRRTEGIQRYATAHYAERIEASPALSRTNGRPRKPL